MKKTLVGLLAVALSFTAFSCDSPVANVKQASTSIGAERAEYLANIRLKTSEEWKSLGVYKIDLDHNDTYWQLKTYEHIYCKEYWDIIRDYGLRVLKDQGVYEEYWFDERAWNHYDHYHWYLNVNGVRIAEYEKVGGFASAAYDHVRLLKSYWDFNLVGR